MGKLFVSFSSAVSETAANAMRECICRWRLHQRNELALNEITRRTSPMVQGWVHYSGRFLASALPRALRTLDAILVW